MNAESSTPDDSVALYHLVGDSRRSEFERLAHQYRSDLRRMVEARLEETLRNRVDPSDVVQDGLFEAFARLDDFLLRRPMRFDLWLRKTTLERLIDVRRRHYAKQRDVRIEVPISNHSLECFSVQLLGSSGVRPALQQAEEAARLRHAIALLEPMDQEILLIRYVDGLNNQEAADLLQLSPTAASKRHGRALIRLTSELRRLGYHDQDHDHE